MNRLLTMDELLISLNKFIARTESHEFLIPVKRTPPVESEELVKIEICDDHFGEIRARK